MNSTHKNNIIKIFKASNASVYTTLPHRKDHGHHNHPKTQGMYSDLLYEMDA